MAEVVVVGEGLVDIVHGPAGVHEAPGGSPANVALALGRLGRDVTLVTRLGDDTRGSLVRAWLEESGVRVAATPAERTSTALARLDDAGAAEYEFDISWELIGDALPSTPLVHHGSIASLLAPGADTLEHLVADARATSAISYDPNVRPSLITDAADARARIARHVAAADIVKASTEDLEWLHPGADPQEVAQAWLDEGPALVVVTAAAEGAFAAYRSGIVGVPARPVRVADTVGAGDTVMGALIDGVLAAGVRAGADAGGAAVRAALHRLDAADLEQLLERALAAAAVTVSRPGADPPWARELPVFG